MPSWGGQASSERGLQPRKAVPHGAWHPHSRGMGHGEVFGVQHGLVQYRMRIVRHCMSGDRNVHARHLGLCHGHSCPDHVRIGRQSFPPHAMCLVTTMGSELFSVICGVRSHNLYCRNPFSIYIHHTSYHQKKGTLRNSCTVAIYSGLGATRECTSSFVR